MAGRRRKDEILIINQDYINNANEFLNKINNVYEYISKKWYKWCSQNNIEYDEDVFSDTILMCYECITRNNIKDLSQQGCEDYLFKSFRNNIKRDKMYSRHQKRDYDTDVYVAQSEYANREQSLYEKIKQQTLNDYSIIHILNLVESEFDIISFFCFRIYHLIPNITYSKLYDMTGVKDCKKRVVEINKWLRNNLTKEDIYKEFLRLYPDFE